VYQYLLKDQPDLIIPLVDAKKKRFYCTFLQGKDTYRMYDIGPEDIMDIIEQQYSDQSIRFAGKDTQLLLSQLPEKFQYQWSYPSDYQAEELLEYTKYHIQNRRLVYPEPLYLRKSEAEIALLSKEKNQL
ncbi:MAG: hypothetical protein MJB14_01435, partial [Spirochaetes bacterium]|nr:hypothetical protein [Spirochaetota bacterium]